MKKSIFQIVSLALMVSGLAFQACQQEELVAEKPQTVIKDVVKDVMAETRNDDGSLYCNVTTTAAGQVDSLVTALATKGDYPREGITHLTISGPINNNDIKTMCNFQYLDSLILTDAVIETIGNSVFRNFKSNAHILLPKTVKSIGEGAFGYYNGESKIKSVYIQDSVKSIAPYAFRYCNYLESIRLPQNITELPYSVFEGCNSLKEVSVPKYVKKIDYRAFYGCSSLEKVELPNQLTEIGYELFRGCSKLDSINWPAYLRYIPDRCFQGCSSLVFEIPSYIETIGVYAFSGCKKMTEYKIPAKVKSIGQYAFEGTGITSLTITDKTMINTGMFNGCFALSSLTISEGVTSLPGYIFQNCDKLTNIKFPSTMKSIGDNAFNECDYLENIEFNENLESLGKYAFHANNSLQTVTIPAKTIGDYAFHNSDKLEKVVLGKNVKSVGYMTFYHCDKLTEVEWNEGLETIGNYSFSKAPLTKIKFPSTLKTIGDDAFDECTSLSEVEFNEGLESIGFESFRCVKINTFVAPSTLKYIGPGAFNTNSALENVILNEGLETIRYRCFTGTSIKTITIPSTVTTGEYELFNACNKLTSVYWKPVIEAPNLRNDDDSSNTLLYLSHGLSSADNPNRIVNGKSQSTILLRSGGIFHCPEAFVSDMQYDRVFNRRYDYASDNVNTESSYDNSYSFQNKPGQASCWQTIVLPFEVTSIKCGDKELVPFGAEKEGAYPFWLRELTPNGFVRATKIEANKAYIIAMPNNEAYADEYNIRGKVSFYAKNVTIPVTEELKESQGPTFNFYPTYTPLGKNAEWLVLNRINEYYDSKSGKNYYYGSVFVPAQYDLGSFGAYVSSPVDSRSVVPIESSLSSRGAHKLGPIPQEHDM